MLGQYAPQVAVNAELQGRFVTTNGSGTPGTIVPFVFAVPDAATSDIDIVVNDKIEVIDVICRKDGGAGAGNTMQIKKGSAAISDAIACAVDKTITRAGTIDVANNQLNPLDTLRLTATKAAGTRTATVTVLAVIRP